MTTNFDHCEWCGADSLTELCPVCQQHAKAALRIAQTAFARARTFVRLDDEVDEVDEDDPGNPGAFCEHDSGSKCPKCDCDFAADDLTEGEG
jgi:uncharacterized protein (UPF0212 family)